MNRAAALLIAGSTICIFAFTTVFHHSPLNSLFAIGMLFMLIIDKYLTARTLAQRAIFALAVAGITCAWGFHMHAELPFYILAFFVSITITAAKGMLEGMIVTAICIATILLPHLLSTNTAAFWEALYSCILMLFSVLIAGSINRVSLDRETENRGLSFLLEFNRLVSSCETEEQLARIASDFMQKQFSTPSSILLATDDGEMQLLNTSNLPANFDLTEKNTTAQMFFTELAWRAFEKQDTVIIDRNCQRTGIPENLIEQIKDYTIFALPMKNVHDMIGLIIIYEPFDSVAKHSFIFHNLELIKTSADILAKSLASIGLLRKYRRAALVDELTGLFNRRSFFSKFYEKLNLAQANESELGFIIFDIDFFKSVNDEHGHKKGDQVLAKCAAIAKSCTRSDDMIARIGGEEFAVILSGTNEETSWQIAERIRSTMAETDFGIGRKVTVSIGLSSFPKHGDSIDELFNKADAALYEVKSSSRNRVEIAAI